MASKNFSGLIFLMCLLDLFTGLNGSQENISLNLKTDGNRKIITIPPNSSCIVQAADIPMNVAVLIYQAHSHTENLSMSEQPKALVHNSVTGRNIGLAIKLHSTDSENQVWVSNFNQEKVRALIVLTTLDSFGPIPGGCNMEFPTEIAPYLRLKSDTLKVYLEYQHASFGSSRDEPVTKCGLSLPYITYEFYVLFLEENNFGEEEYFKKVEYMSNVSSIKSHSSKAKSYSLHPDTRFSFMMYPNLGVVYNVIAKYTINNEVKEAAYIPSVSYGCSPLDFTEDGCRVRFSFKGKTFLFLLSIYGFVVAFFGHSFIGGVVPFFGLLISFLIGFILIGKYLTFSKETTAELSIIVGLLGGLLFLFLWLWLRHPLVLFLLNGFVLGLLITSTIFYTPLGNAEIFVNDKNFWSLLSVGTLFITILSVALPYMMTAFGSSIVGCYLMLLFYDDFIGTRLSYIILNIIKRAVSRNLAFASNDVPFQTKDIIMSVLWIVLSFFSMIIWVRKRQSTIYRMTRANSGFSTSIYTRYRQGLIYVPTENDVIRQPLLREDGAVFYHTFPQ